MKPLSPTPPTADPAAEQVIRDLLDDIGRMQKRIDELTQKCATSQAIAKALADKAQIQAESMERQCRIRERAIRTALGTVDSWEVEHAIAVADSDLYNEEHRRAGRVA